MTAELEFTVLGRPMPAGSKRAFTPKGANRPVVVDANPNAKPWKQQVAGAAREAAGGRVFGQGTPVMLQVCFILARPKSHYGTGRNRDVLKRSAPAHPTSMPDATKLLRGVEDAMTAAGVWHDDAQVVEQYVWKEFGWPERCEVRARAMYRTVGAVDMEGAA